MTPFTRKGIRLKMSINQSLVSVIIPAYNYEDYVAEAIDSVLAQTYPYVEIIVVDDGSTDRTAQVVAGFGCRVCYERKVNGGLATARNYGIERAQGDLLVFLDADDLLEPSAIERMVAKLTQLGDEFALVAARYIAINESGDRLDHQVQYGFEEGVIFYRQLLLRSRFCPAVLVRRAVMLDLGMFDTNFGTAEQGSEDRDMWVRIAALHGVYMLQESLILKRDHNSNMSSNAARQTASTRRTLAKARSAGVVSRWSFPLWASVYAVQHFQSAIMYRECGDYRGALREILQSFIVCPWPISHRDADLPAWFRLKHLLVLIKRMVFRKRLGSHRSASAESAST